MLKLEFPNSSHKIEHEKFMKKWRGTEDTPSSPGKLFYGENFEEFLAEIQKDKTDNQYGVNSHLFFLMKDQKILGAIQIRHDINHPNLIEKGGHIGYGIAPDYRRKGYATEMLKLGLIKARKMGIKKVLITCDVDNIASAKVITKNGGVFERITKCGEANRYWIDL